MKRALRFLVASFLLVAIPILLSFIAVSPVAAQETINSRIGKLSLTHDFANGYPTDETVRKLFRVFGQKIP
ncbi:MAG: hypothetical protein P8168_13745 [Deltaproteobacteria bacterium]|jgi:hypothetical protein